jgi:hypothetical protein
MLKKSLSLGAFLCTSLLFLNFSAQAASLNERLMQCAVLKDSLERLVCYDQLTKSARTAPEEALTVQRAPVTAAPVMPVAQPKSPTIVQAPAEQAKSAEEEFGLEHKQTEEQKNTDNQEMVIKAAKQNQYDQWTITFTNGQKWKQVDNTNMKFKEGDKVIISRGFWNSFNLKKAGSNRSMKVKRTS